ncbi:MAG: TolC family protein [Opitutales bacterium]|nr:TolC family protein [Opitutales bacterium]
MKNFLMKKNLWLALAAGTLLAGTACSTVDEAREAQKPENRLRGERTVAFAEYGFPAGAVLSLADLEKIALDANPKIFQARQAVISAQLAVKDIRADYLPTLDASAAYSRGTNNTTERGQSFHSTGGNEIGLSLDLLLWDFGKTDAKLEQAVARLLSAEKDLLSAENLVRYNVRKAYFELRRNIELDVVAEQSVSQYKEHLAQMRAYRDAGKVTKYDCTKAEVDYNNAVLQSISIANNVKTARADLNLALGFAESPDYELGGNVMGSFEPDVAALMSIALEREPGLASLVALEKAASAHIDKTVADLFPSVGLNFSATLEGEDLDMPKVWNLLGVGKISPNVFNGGRNLRAIEDAVAKLRVARSKVAAYEQQLYASLTTAVLTLTRALKQYEVALLSESAAKENFDIVTAQFNVGKASALDRTDAQVSLTEARAATVSSEYDFREAVSAIAYLIATDPAEEQVGD